jgi:integrase/recombinase XerD
VEETNRGAHRIVHLHRDVADALASWLRARPPAASDRIVVSLQGRPDALSLRAVNRVVARYADQALLPPDRRTPHVLHHSFCTLLADDDLSTDLIAELAGHKDVRTTRVHTAISDAPRRRAIDGTSDPPTGAQLLAASDMGEPNGRTKCCITATSKSSRRRAR